MNYYILILERNSFKFLSFCLYMMLICVLFGCEDKDNYGTYLMECDGVSDTLVLSSNGTFYHVVYDTKQERILFKQNSHYQKVGDNGYSLPEYKRSVDSKAGWDFDVTTHYFNRAIYFDSFRDIYYIKQ